MQQTLFCISSSRSSSLRRLVWGSRTATYSRICSLIRKWMVSCAVGEPVVERDAETAKLLVVQVEAEGVRDLLCGDAVRRSRTNRVFALPVSEGLHLVHLRPDSCGRRLSSSANRRIAVTISLTSLRPSAGLVSGLLVFCLRVTGCGGAATNPGSAQGDSATGGDRSASAESFPATVLSGDLGGGEEVTVEARPVAIVSLSPTATEMLWAIGAGEQVVAVDDQSDYPPGVPTTTLSGKLVAVLAYRPDPDVMGQPAARLVHAGTSS